jgi:hypothetical protein
MEINFSFLRKNTPFISPMDFSLIKVQSSAAQCQFTWSQELIFTYRLVEECREFTQGIQV